MNKITLVFVATVVSLAGCKKEPVAPVQVETLPLRATVTPDNHCTVEALGRTYTSIGQVRGAVLPNFAGTLDSDGWHAIGCWVSNVDGTDGELVLTFSGNSFQQPFATGTFEPRYEAPWGSSDKLVNVSFRASYLGNEMLKTVNESPGSVVVESAPNGSRTIRVDVGTVKVTY